MLLSVLIRVWLRNLDKFGTRHSSQMPVFSLFFSTIPRSLWMLLYWINPTLTKVPADLLFCY